MRKYFVFVLTLIVLLGLSACGAQSDTDGGAASNGKKNQLVKLQLGTGSPGGTYFPLGQEIATILNNNVAVKGFKVSAVSTGASVENLAKIGQGKLQLGMTVHTTAQNAAKGEGQFKGHKVDNFGFMGHIYPEIMQIVTLKSTGVNSIADLKGKKVAIGPPGSGTQAAAKLILKAYGIEDGDYKAYEEGFGDASGKLQNGTIDASFGFLGAPAAGINELQAVSHKVKFLEVKGDGLKNVLKLSGYGKYIIPAGTYNWLDKPVQTVSAYSILVGSTSQISEELGYKITKAFFENAGNITHEQAKYITKKKALLGSEDMPLHPGAKRYFKEQGWLEE
ncbi:MAG TPA: TAXI family TRAP transporter solute-binding subunit [Bacillales bacterium]